MYELQTSEVFLSRNVGKICKICWEMTPFIPAFFRYWTKFQKKITVLVTREGISWLYYQFYKASSFEMVVY